MHKLPRRATTGLGQMCAAIFVVCLMSCMSLNIGGRVYECKTEDGLFVQTGQARVPASSELDVYYPAPYASTPNLELDDTWSELIIIAQYPNHFRVKNCRILAVTADWKARGVRGVPGMTPHRGPISVAPPIPIDTTGVQK